MENQRVWVLGALFACVRMLCKCSIHAVFLYACAFVRMNACTYVCACMYVYLYACVYLLAFGPSRHRA